METIPRSYLDSLIALPNHTYIISRDMDLEGTGKILPENITLIFRGGRFVNSGNSAVSVRFVNTRLINFTTECLGPNVLVSTSSTFVGSGVPEDVVNHGSFSDKPSLLAVNVGFQYFNTDTHMWLTWGGSAWYNPDGTVATE